MKELQFFTNGKTFTYIDVNSPTFEEERKQLLMQGFILDGGRIKAETVNDAIEKHKNSSGDRMKEYAVISVVSGLFGGF